MSKSFLVNEDGVVLQEIEDSKKIISLEDGDRILRKGTLEYLNDTTDIKYHFTKSNPKIFDKYCKNIQYFLI